MNSSQEKVFWFKQRNTMKNNFIKIQFETFLQSQRCWVCQYVSNSKTFWKDVAKHYKRISNEL